MEQPNIQRFEIIKRFIERKDEEALVACLERLEKKSEVIGRGENAEILALTEDPYLSGVCVKKMKEFPKIKDNRPEEEFAYQEKAKDLGINTPLNICHIKDNKTGQEYILMQRIIGVSLGQIQNGEVRMPDNYDHEKFFAKLSSDLKKMHEDNIYHRDLHSGNVMVDQNGDPVIIDFGTATLAFSGDDNKYWEGQVMMYNSRESRYEKVSGYYRNDEDALVSLKDTMKTYWFNRESHKDVVA